MKKLIALVLALCIMPVVVFCEPQTATSSAAGFGGDVTVTLTVENGTLTDVVIEGPNETTGVGSNAVEQMPAKFMNYNSVDVDGIAGATVTSNAIKTAASAALAELGVTLTANDAAGEKAELEAVSTDILVIGAGGAGLAAAATAAEEGAKVIIIEKLGFTGGSTAQSGGVFTRGAIEGDPEGTMTGDELYDYMFEISEEKADPAVVRAYIDNAPATLDWAFSLGDGVKETVRYHMFPENIMAIRPWGDATAAATGIILTSGMEKGAVEKGADLRLNTAATSLIVEDGKVVGARVESEDGIYSIYANAVILCTGGFSHNQDLIEEYGMANANIALIHSSAGATGDGLIMAREIGAKVQFGNDWDTNGYHTLAATGYTNYLNMVLVNGNGERFHREEDQLPPIYTDMMKQAGKGMVDFYLLTDPNLDPDPDALIGLAGAVKCDTIEDLAALIGCDLETLKGTLAAYNENKGKDDPLTGKQAMYMQGLEAPYYAVKITPIRTVTIGGLVIDKDAHVISESGEAIPGLYAAGEVANGSLYYNTYAACGTAVGHAIIFGRIAAKTAVQAMQ